MNYIYGNIEQSIAHAHSLHFEHSGFDLASQIRETLWVTA